MLLNHCFSDTKPFQPLRFPLRWDRSLVDTHTIQAHPLEPVTSVSSLPRRASKLVGLTSIKQKLGTGSSPSDHHPVPNAPVALPGLTKNLPSSSYASNLCVPPHNNTSTSICRAAINKLSGSPGGIIVWPCVKPMRSEPCVMTFDRARFGASTSKSPLTICRSGAIPRRKS